MQSRLCSASSVVINVTKWLLLPFQHQLCRNRSVDFEVLMQVSQRIWETSTCLEINYISRPAYSFVMGWLWVGIFLISMGCFGLWYASTQLQVNVQLTCERALLSEINCQLDSSTFLEQRSQELRQLQTVQLRRMWWTEDDYQIVFISAFGEVASIADNDRPSLKRIVDQVNAFTRSPGDRTLRTDYDMRWKGIWLLGFISFWLIMVLLMFPGPLFDVEFRYICAFDKVSNQATRLKCALLEKCQETWQLDDILNVQLDEEPTEDGIFHVITLVLNSGEQTPLLSWRQLPMQRAQFAWAAHRIRQFLNMD
jgi:hypothetical protein